MIPVSIPLRKVSRAGAAAPAIQRRHVSIPLRKVSRRSQFRQPQGSFSCFHPSKEGFKAYREGERRWGATVSIPLRKVSRAASASAQEQEQSSFHPSKEGFKVIRLIAQKEAVAVSIPLRKVSRVKPPSAPIRTLGVSIPLRKVSRCCRSGSFSTSDTGFHPSKEGFKAREAGNRG